MGKHSGTYSLADILSGVKWLDGEPYVDPVTRVLNVETDPAKRFSVSDEGEKQYSLSSAIDTGLNKAESYVNRNVRKPNAKTAEGRTAAIFNNTHNKNNAQTWVAWLKNKKDKFYREWVDKNDALHQLDDFLEKAGGKKLNESEKIYRWQGRCRTEPHRHW